MQNSLFFSYKIADFGYENKNFHPHKKKTDKKKVKNKKAKRKQNKEFNYLTLMILFYFNNLFVYS